MGKGDLRLSLPNGFILVALFFVVGCERYDVIVEDLAQRDANEILVLLREERLDAKKIGQPQKKGTVYQISVKHNQAEDALRLLVRHQIPKTYRPSLKDVFPPGASGIIPSKSDEMARMIMAMQGESEALLKVIPGILDARVVISYESPQNFQSDFTKKSASVAVIYETENEFNSSPLTDNEIRNLVAASIGGVSPDDIQVIQKMLPKLMKRPQQTLNEPPPMLEQSNLKKNTLSQTPLYLMLLTVAALLLSGYAIVRLIIQKQKAAFYSAYQKDPNL